MNIVLAAIKARYDKLNPRERMSLGLAAAALILGVEFLAVQPLQEKRKTVSQALSASERSELESRAAAAEARRLRNEEVERRMQRVSADLAAYGIAGPSKDSLSFLLTRTLEGQKAKVVSLRTLTAESLPIEPPADPSAAPAAQDGATALPTAVAAVQAAASAAEAGKDERLIYRHRYELKLEGPLKDLTPAVDALQNNARPLRVERLRIAALPGGALEATVVLVTMGTEKAWLKL